MNRLALATAGLALLLSGCGTTDPAQPVEPTTTAVSPTKAGPAEPTLPATASEQTKAGAIAFAKYYWEVVDYAQTAGNTAKLRSLASPACKACKAGTNALDAIAQAGGTSRGGKHLVRRVWVPIPPDGSGRDAVVILRFFVTRQVVTNAGTLSRTYEPGTDQYTMTLRHTGDHWAVISWSV